MKGYINHMERYKISVIVPVYNAERYIKKCAASLTGQTYENLEILLIDDGSTDKSGTLCDQLAGEDKRIKVIHKENGGLISAWKRGVAESSGEYLNFIDSDDWADLNMIEEMAAQLTGNEREIVASDYIIERENGSRQYVWQQLPPGVYDRKAMEEQVIPNLLGRESRYVTISRCMKLISRKLIEENCKYSNPLIRAAEDLTIMFPALVDTQRLVIMDHKAYYHYLYVKESMIHKYDKGLFENNELLRQIINQIIIDKFPANLLREMQEKADREYLLSLLLVLKNEARGNPEGYRKNILNICRKEEIKNVVRATDIQVKENANRLLYLVLRHPNHLTVSLLRAAMILYYKRR